MFYHHKKPAWMRATAFLLAAAFAWVFILATPAQLMAQSSSRPKPGLRTLTTSEMEKIVGRQSGTHYTSCDSAPGSTYPWEASVAGTNTGNGNKLTSIPIVGWTGLGGMPVSFTLSHNSQSTHNSELGQKWTHSYDLYLVVASGDSGNTATVHWRRPTPSAHRLFERGLQGAHSSTASS